MHHQHARCAATPRLLELVGPAAIEGHGVSVELARDRIAVGRLEVGIVDQDDDDLAAHVHVLEIVPLALGRRGAIADEDHGRVGHRDVVGRPVAGHQNVGTALQADGLAANGRGDGRRTVLARARKMSDLDEGAVRPAALGPRGFELFDQPGDGLFLAGRGGGAAFEFVRRQDPNRLIHPRGVDVRLRLLRQGRRAGHHQGQDGNSGEGVAHRRLLIEPCDPAFLSSGCRASR